MAQNSLCSGARSALKDRHLVVDEGGGLTLDHFDNAGAGFFQSEDAGLAEALAGEDLPGGPLSDHDGVVCLVEVCQILRRTGGGEKCPQTSAEVGLGKSHLAGPLRGSGHGGNDEIDLTGFQSRNEPDEGNVLDLQGAPEIGGEGAS